MSTPTKDVAEMMGDRAAEVATLKAVRLLANTRPDQFPHACYTTEGLAQPKAAGLNCPVSRQREGVVRFYVAAKTRDDVAKNAEALQSSLIGWAATGPAYRIRSVTLADVSDTFEDDSDPEFIVYVRSIDFAVKALKL